MRLDRRHYFQKVDVQDKLESRGIVHFHRGSVLCALSKTPANVYWGHVGLVAGSPFSGRIFINAGGVRLYKVQMGPTGNSSIDRRWWLGFEGSRPYSFDKTLEELKLAADYLNAADRDHAP